MNRQNHGHCHSRSRILDTVTAMRPNRGLDDAGALLIQLR